MCFGIVSFFASCSVKWAFFYNNIIIIFAVEAASAVAIQNMYSVGLYVGIQEYIYVLSAISDALALDITTVIATMRLPLQLFSDA